MADISSMLPRLTDRDGPLTQEMLLAPAKFGLGMLPAGARPEAVVRSTCGYCSTGCSLDMHLQAGAAVGLTPSVDYPVNLGMACPKGWEALAPLRASNRATTPLLRGPDGQLSPIDWPSALQTFVARMKEIQGRHGEASVAFLGTGQLVNEELALLGALAKFGMGMVHGDGNTRQCMATAVVAYKEAFGFDAPPYSYADFEESDVIVLVGSNLCIAHPILWQRVMRNRHRPKIVVIDPRLTETAMAASQHVAPYPKSDLALLYGVARLLIEWQGIDRAFIERHTRGFDEFRDFVQAYTLGRVAGETRLHGSEILQLAETILEGKRVSFWWTMGVNQSHQGVRTAQAIINLALMTGNIGRPGTGANSITGQCNAMGSRLYSNTTNLFGGRDFTNAGHRADVARILSVDEQRIPSQPSWPYHRIFQGILDGKIRGLWVVCTNPAHSWINQDQAKDILGRLEFLAVQDMYADTETAQLAHLVLPAAGWGEKDGTFINSERRVGVVRKVARAPGQALADFHIFRLVADAWGCGEMFREWSTPASVFQILKRLSAGSPADITGVADYAALDEQGGIQWPCLPGQEPAAERRLFEDGRFYHPDGRARFIFEAPRHLREPPNDRYPFLLLTGRGTAAQWHTQTRTANSAVLRKLYPAQLYLEMNPADAAALGVSPDQTVVITSQRGELRARAVLTAAVQRGQIFLPMHYEATNLLTDAVFDPYSHQPAYKACAVRISALSHE